MEADGFSEDTDPLIEVTVVLHPMAPRISCRPSRYDHLATLAVVPLRRFCERPFRFVRPSANLARGLRMADAD